MDDPRESDIFDTKMDLIDLSKPTIDQESLLLSDTINQGENPGQQQGVSIASSTMSRGGGFCVKEYEEQLENLQKENFNLKLRVYFLEQKNPNVPDDVESLMAQMIDLKVQNESLYKDLQEKQELLCQASKALELLEEAKMEDESHVEKVVEDLKEKVKFLESENHNLQQALSEAHNKTNLANDTGFTEFLGAVEAKDADIHRKMVEITQHSEELQYKINEMTILMEQLEVDKHELSEKVSKLQYEKDEIKDKLENVQSSSGEMQRKFNLTNELIQEKDQETKFWQASNFRLHSANKKLHEECEKLQYSNFELTMRIQELLPLSNLEQELRDYKDRWASSQCDLQDAETKYKDTEEERQKALKILQTTLETLAESNQKVEMYEQILKQTSSMDKNEAKKEIEIMELKRELENTQKKLQHLTTSELQEKNKEIERLTELINSLRVDRYSISSEPPRFSFDYLYETFNDLKFQQAMEIKKQSQQKIDQLMMELETMTNSKTLKQLEQLKHQMAIVAEKQQITDSALSRCTELCAYTLDHLQELTQFLTTLLQNKQIRESLSEASLHNIQNIIEKSLDLSHRQSMGNFSFNDISSLDVLVNAARQSIANIREVQQSITQSSNKGIQATSFCDTTNTSTVTDYEELKRVNQLLEDEIVEIKNTMRVYEKKSNEYKSEIVELKSVKDELNEKIEKSESAMRLLEVSNRNLQLVCDDYKVEVESLTRKFGSLRDELLTKTEAYQECFNSLNATTEELKRIQTKNYQLESQLDYSHKTVQTLEVAKLKYESMWKESDRIAKELETRLKHIEHDLQDNWITKTAHTNSIKNMQDEIVNAEAQVAAIRMELEKMKVDCNQKRSTYNQSNTVEDEEFKENDATTNTRRPIDISEDRKKLLLSNEPDCKDCPGYQKKIVDLKKHLQVAVDKLKEQAKFKQLQEKSIQKQLSKTENVINQARINMESILKAKNTNEQQ